MLLVPLNLGPRKVLLIQFPGMCRRARRAVTKAVAEAKAQTWEEFGEAMDKKKTTFEWPQRSSGKPFDTSGERDKILKL